MAVQGTLGRARFRLGHAALLLGAKMHISLADLGLWIDPRLSSGYRSGRRIRPWLGLVVLMLLAAGLVFVGEGAICTLQAALPYRESRP